MVSLGKDGAIFIDEKNDIYRVSIPKVNIKNPVGSGDSTIAGFAYGLNENKSPEETLKLAMACGISNAMMDETGNIDLDVVKELFNKVKVEKI